MMKNTSIDYPLFYLKIQNRMANTSFSATSLEQERQRANEFARKAFIGSLFEEGMLYACPVGKRIACRLRQKS
ncbi:hypothetical protein DXK91_02870 [Parageobacillus toebii]|nr:hypothetical protein DXK91_02870 [Parageobacillus toebii]